MLILFYRDKRTDQNIRLHGGFPLSYGLDGE